MRNIEQLAVVIVLACLTGDRSKQEQAALVAVAQRTDKERNNLTATNPRAKELGVRVCGGGDRWSTQVYEFGIGGPRDHKRDCQCRGNGVMVAVQSELAALAEDTWEHCDGVLVDHSRKVEQ